MLIKEEYLHSLIHYSLFALFAIRCLVSFVVQKKMLFLQPI